MHIRCEREVTAENERKKISLSGSSVARAIIAESYQQPDYHWNSPWCGSSSKCSGKDAIRMFTEERK